MLAIYSALVDSGFLPLLVVVAALLLEWIIPWPEKAHPLTLLRLMALNLAAKVNPSSPRTSTQRRISGSLAIIVLLLPILVIVSIPLLLAEYPLFFDTLMLLVAIQFQPIRRHFKALQKALKTDKKNLARHHLNGMVLRETDKLTPMGIAKAAIESLNQRFIYQQFSILFWYVLAGGLVALIVRMFFELSQTWNTKLRKNQDFGVPAALISQILFLIPQVFFLFIFSLANNVIGAYRSLKSVSQTQHYSTYVKAIIGGSMGFQLGGPAFYQNLKVRSQRVGATREVRFADLQRSWNSVNQTLLMFLALLTLILAIMFKLG